MYPSCRNVDRIFDNNRETWKWVVLGIGNVLTNSRHFERKEKGKLYVIEELFGSWVRKVQLCLLGKKKFESWNSEVRFEESGIPAFGLTSLGNIPALSDYVRKALLLLRVTIHEYSEVNFDYKCSLAFTRHRS
jgi:hypothetical protein